MFRGVRYDFLSFFSLLLLLGVNFSQPCFAFFRIFGPPRRPTTFNRRLQVGFVQPNRAFAQSAQRIAFIRQPRRVFVQPRRIVTQPPQRFINSRSQNQNLARPQQPQEPQVAPHTPSVPGPLASPQNSNETEPPTAAPENQHSGTTPEATQNPQPSRPIAEPGPQPGKKNLLGKIQEGIANRPRLFQSQRKAAVLDEATKIFCENPYQWVCETSAANLPGTSWPDIFSNRPQEAFGTGKEILNYLTDNHFKYEEKEKQFVVGRVKETQVWSTQIGGPMAFSGPPPQIQVPNTGYWNLFSVFHELGHIIDFSVRYPLDKGEVIKLLRQNSQISNVDQIESFFNDKRAEITADKVAAKGFAFLADPHMRKIGYDPIDTRSLLKTLKTSMGFLCKTPGGDEHPSGRFRINFIGADDDLRSVLGCPVHAEQ